MQREILFRGKRKDNNRWTYGSLIQDVDVCRIHVYGIGESHEVFPDSVSQCIGLKDKNGIPIYEGDRLKRTQHIDGNFIDRIIERYEVAYNSAIAGFEYKPIDGKEYKQYTIRPFHGEEIEVIDNIHNNPELVNPAQKESVSNSMINDPAAKQIEQESADVAQQQA